MTSEEAMVAERMKSVSRPGFLAAYLLLAFRNDGTGRVKITDGVIRKLTRLAENFVSYGRPGVTFSKLIPDGKMKNAIEALGCLEDWELSEPDRFQARFDILCVENHLLDNKGKYVDKQERITLVVLQGIINDLWKKAVEKPHQLQPTKK